MNSRVARVRVLLVEDFDDDALLVTELLTRSLDAVVVTRARTTDEVARGLDDRPDVVVTDADLRTFSALDVLRLRDDHQPDLPVVVISGRIGDDAGADLLAEGAADYLLKDRLSRLAPAIQRVIEDRRRDRARIRAERHAAETESRWAKLVRSTSDILAVFDDDGRTLFINDAVEEVLGVRAAALIGRSGWDRVHPEDVAETKAALRWASEHSAAPVAWAVRLRHADGAWVHTEAVATSMRDDESVGGMVVSHTDITDRVRTEQRLEAEARLLQRLADGDPLKVVVAAILDRLRDHEVAVGLRVIDSWSGLSDIPVEGPVDLELPVNADERHVATLLVAGRNTGTRRFDSDARVATDLLSIAFRAERHRLQDAYGALHDSLTDLPNHTWFRHHVQGARSKGGVGVLVVDVDDFGLINQAFGNQAGDALLVRLAVVLRAVVGEGAIARVAGDQFGVAVSNPRDGQLSQIGEQLLAAVRTTGVDALSMAVSACVGGASATPDAHDVDLLDVAISALRRAKRGGRGRLVVTPVGPGEAVAERLQLAQDLRTGIAASQLRCVLQPIVSLADGAVVGAEGAALVRSIGRWMLEAVAATVHLLPPWDRAVVSVNADARQLLAPTFTADVFDLLEAHGLTPDQLAIEVTETSMVEGLGPMATTLRELREDGVAVYLDDFGTGYSSLAYLKDLPVDVLKIDRTFVSGMTSDDRAAGLVQSVVGLAEGLGLVTVAEGVETAEQANMLRDMGVDRAQGFFFARPMDHHSFSRFLLRTKRDRNDLTARSSNRRVAGRLDDEGAAVTAVRGLLRAQTFGDVRRSVVALVSDLGGLGVAEDAVQRHLRARPGFVALDDAPCIPSEAHLRVIAPAGMGADSVRTQLQALEDDLRRTLHRLRAADAPWEVSDVTPAPATEVRRVTPTGCAVAFRFASADDVRDRDFERTLQTVAPSAPTRLSDGSVLLCLPAANDCDAVVRSIVTFWRLEDPAHPLPAVGVAPARVRDPEAVVDAAVLAARAAHHADDGAPRFLDPVAAV